MIRGSTIDWLSRALAAAIALAALGSGCEWLVGGPPSSSDAGPSNGSDGSALLSDAGFPADGATTACTGAINGSWSLVSPGASGGLVRLAGTGADDVWAVGGRRALHYDGSGALADWYGTTLPAGLLTVDDISVVSKDEAFAASKDTGGLRWTSAGGWQVLSGTSTSLQTVWAPGPGEAWFISQIGVAHHWKEGLGWSTEVDPILRTTSMRFFFAC